MKYAAILFLLLTSCAIRENTDGSSEYTADPAFWSVVAAAAMKEALPPQPPIVYPTNK